MSEIPPQDNPLLNTNHPQRGGYLSPAPGAGVGPNFGHAPIPAPPSVPVSPTAAPVVVATQPAAQAAGPETRVVAPMAPSNRGRVGGAGAGGKDRKPSKPEVGLAGLVDTIEAVVIALILALTFREFVVEPFVIPTGSMAPTLLGAHFNVICPKCGYAFKEGADLNWQEAPDTHIVYGQSPRGELISSRTVAAPELRICPNCGYGIGGAELPGTSSRDTHPVTIYQMSSPTPPTLTFPWANNGDRILVLKYLYCVLEPRRWDVIVFKEPMKAADNFIKRLVGLPGEDLEVVGGDLFIRPPSQTGEPQKPMTVARKPTYVQNAVWQLVYDNDYYPTDADAPRETGIVFTNPWKGEGATADAWSIRGPVITYGDNAGQEANANAIGKMSFIPRDFYMYNVRGYNNDLFDRLKQFHQPVTDVHVEAAWMPADAGGASMAMTVGPDGNCFRVRWSGGGPGGLKLERWTGKEYEAVTDATMVSAVRAPIAGEWHRVAMNNVDRQVQFFIDGEKVLEYNTPWTVEDATAWVEQHQGVDAEKQMAHVSVEVGGKCTLSHVKLMRDVYYTNSNLTSRLPWEMERGGEAMLSRGVMGHPVHLGPDEFFAMGDNSTASYDSRGWNVVHPSLNDLPVGQEQHLGIVPRRFLLGRAFFVYWPSGFRPMNVEADSSLKTLDVPLVPNVGEMRFIR